MGKKKEETVATEEENNDGAEGTTEENASVVEDSEEAAEESAAEEDVDYEAEAAKNKDLYLRALADLENYRKRAQREKDDAIRFANTNLLRELIPVIDNLERAVEHADDDQDQGLLEGVKMTLDQFRKVLEMVGVKAVAALGETFNPEYHQAMGEMVTAEYEPGLVAQELQKGYILNERLLRPAMVMVAKAPEPEAAEESEENQDPDETPESE